MRWLVIAGLALASCGGTAQAPTSTSAGSTQQQATSAPTAAATAAGSAAASAQASAGPAFADVIRSGKSATYKIAYKWTTTSAGQTQTVTQTWTFKPPKARLDWTVKDPASGATSTISWFEIETGSFLCTAAGGQTFCVKSDEQGAVGQNPAFGLQESFEQNPGAFSGATQTTRTIAGQQGLCYVMTGLQVIGGADGTFCYTSSGIPLLLEWKLGTDSWSMEATSFSTAVADGEFTLPATPVSY